MLGAVGENPMEEVKLAFDAGGAHVVNISPIIGENFRR